MGKVATSAPTTRGSPPLQSGGKTTSDSRVGILATSPLRLGGSRLLQSGGENHNWPAWGKVATSLLPSWGSPALQSGGQNQKGPTCGKRGYVTPSVSGIPTASERGVKSEVAYLRPKWLRHPCRLRDPQPFGAGGKKRRGPHVGKVATSPLPSRGSQLLQSGVEIQKEPTCGQTGYVSPAVSGIPTASEREAKSERGPCLSKVATSPLPCRGSPPLHSEGKNQKWSTCGQGGYVTSAVSEIPTAPERGAKSEVAHLWAKWLRHPCGLGDPDRFRAGDKIRRSPLVGKVATSPLPSGGLPLLQSGGRNQKWPTCGQSGYLTPAVSGIPTPSERGAKREGAHMWAKWLRHPCRLGDPHCFRAGGKIRRGPRLSKVAMSPLLCRQSPQLQSEGQNQKWATCGQSGYVTAAVSGIPTAPERGEKSEVAHFRAKWLRHPCRLGYPHRCRAGGKIRRGPLVGKVATSTRPSRGSRLLQSGGENQRGPTCGQSGYKWAPSDFAPHSEAVVIPETAGVT